MEYSSSSPGSSKKVKALGSMTQTVSCLVDGCNSDLSQCRDYYRRHKVCELHSKTREVTIKGQEQRFCQQCSRFHSLVEFDEEKRSCRKRLDGHNRRRRKPQSELMHRTSAIFGSDHPGSTILSFSNPAILPTAASSSTWTKAIKIEDDNSMSNTNLNYIDQHELYPRSAAQNYNAQLRSLGCSNSPAPETSSFCQQLLEPNSVRGMNQIEFLGRLHQTTNSNGAPSLLSSEQIETSVAGSNHMAHPNYPGHFPPSQSYMQNTHFTAGLDQYQHFTQTRQLVTDTGSNFLNNSNISTPHFEGACEHGLNGSSESGSQHNLSFRLD